MLTISVMRNKGWYGRVRTAQIMADEEEIGLVKSGESVRVQIPAGAENIFAKMDWGWSAPYPVSKLSDGQTIYMNGQFTFNFFKNLGATAIPIVLEDKPR